MSQKKGPYLGVTGFMHRAEVDQAIAMIPEGSARRLMVGILMSSQTLNGQEERWPGRYPKREAVAGIIVDDQRVLNLVHYATANPQTLCAQLLEITELAGPALDGFQLNMAWPSIRELEKYRAHHPEKFIVLQIGSHAMTTAGSIERFTEFLSAYIPLIDAILIDASGGMNKPLDPAKGGECLRAASRFPSLGLGIAGGLSSDTLHYLDPLIEEFPQLSADAEGGLQFPPPKEGLCIPVMCDYLEDGFPTLAGKKLPGIKLRSPCAPYGFERYLKNNGLGDNMLRTNRLAQPGALNPGDLLATGDRVLSLPREGWNGSVFLHLTGGRDGHWIKVPARIPIALLTKDDNAPDELWDLRK